MKTGWLRFLWMTSVLIGGLLDTKGEPKRFDQGHALLDSVLKKHVRNGLVDYASLKAAPQMLNAYLKQVAGVPKRDFNSWSQNDQIAFLLNAYNAYTLRLILDHYPVSSIKKIGGWFSGPWDQKIVNLFDETTTLATIEHKMLRTGYSEPRIHFALVCAALGCPPLRNEAYLGEKLHEQLEDQGRTFLASSDKNRVDVPNKRIYLSPIFDWFEKDFEETSGSVIQFVQPYFPAPESDALRSGGFSIKSTDYDWDLNEFKNATSAEHKYRPIPLP